MFMYMKLHSKYQYVFFLVQIKVYCWTVGRIHMVNWSGSLVSKRLKCLENYLPFSFHICMLIITW